MVGLFDPIERPAQGAPKSTADIQLGELPLRDLSPAMFDPPCAACQFPLPFRLLLRPGFVKVPIVGQPTVVFIREVRQEAFDKRTVIAKVEGTDLMRDRSGVIRYSDVEVQFRYDLLRNERASDVVGFEVGEEPSPLTTEWLDYLHPAVERVSLFAVNRLLRTYRFLSGEHYVRPITLNDIFYMQTGWLIPELQSPFKMALGAPGQTITLEAHPFSDEFHHALGRWLAAEKDIPIWMELIQDAREYLEVGRFRHVVIDSRTALKTYVDQTLLSCFRQRGLSPSQAAAELRLSETRAQSVSSVADAIRWARINDKLKYGLAKSLGIRIAQRKVWNGWLTVKEVREGSVHFGEQVPEEEARQCLEVVETLIGSIHEAGSPVSAGLKPENTR